MPLTMVESTPPGEVLPPPPQRATPARKGARCGAGAGSPRPHRPQPRHTGRGTLAARSRGRAAGGGTAPDTRRPSQRWQATPPGDGPPPPPQHAAPTGHAGQGNSVGPPHPHTCTHSTWVADPNSPPSGRAVGGGTAPDLRRPSQWWKAPPPGMPFPQPHSEQRWPARAHAVGPLLGPHARTDRTRDTRDAEPWLPAPEDGRLGEGQRLTPGAPHNGGGPPSPGTAPHHPRGTQPPQGMQAKGTVLGPKTHTPTPTAHGWRTPTARPDGQAFGGGTAPDLRRPSQRPKAPPPGTPLSHPHSEQRRPAWAHAVGPVLGPHTRNRPHPGHTGRGTLAARSRGWAAGGGTAPDTRRPSQRWRATLPGDGPPPPPRHAAPAGHAGRGDSVGPPHPHTRAHSTWVADPNSPPSGRAVGGRDGAWPRTPPTMVEGTPPGDALPPPPQRATPASKGARCGAGAGSPHLHRPHPGHTGRGILAARSRGRAAGGGTAPDTRRPSQRLRANPPRDGSPPPPRHTVPTGHASQGDGVGPPRPHTCAHSTWVADPNSPPNGRAVGGGTAPDLRRPSPWLKAPPLKDALPPPPQRATPARKGARCGAGAGPPRPHRPRPGHVGHGTLAPRSRGRVAGGGTAPNTRRPSKWWKAPPPGMPIRHPHNEQRTNAPTHQPRDIRTRPPALRHSHTTIAEPAAPRKTRPRSPTLDEAQKVIRALILRDGEGDPPQGDAGTDSDLEAVPEPPTGGTPAEPAPPAVSVPALCPAWKRGHCTGEGWCPKQHPSPAPMTERCPR